MNQTTTITLDTGDSCLVFKGNDGSIEMLTPDTPDDALINPGAVNALLAAVLFDVDDDASIAARALLMERVQQIIAINKEQSK